MKQADVEIELAGRYTSGASVIDFMSKTPNAEVAVDVDVDKFADWFIKSIQNAEQERK